jgi:SOS-response transcriptional repressor LexA
LFDNSDMPGTLETNPTYEALMALRPADLTPNAWAVKAGVSRSVWTDIRKHGAPTRKTLERLLGAVGVSVAQFELSRYAVHSEVIGTGLSVQDIERPYRGPLRDKRVPLLGTAYGGEWSDGVELTELHLSEVLDYLARPPSLDNDPESYAVEIVGESMAPRFEPGERAWVSPKSPVRPGDDVIVQLRGDAPAEGDDRRDNPDFADRVSHVLIKRLVRQSAKFVVLQQFNPAETFEVPAARVAAIHRVRGRL